MAMIAVHQDANLDRLSALIDAAAARADDRVVLFDFVLAISELWSRLGLRRSEEHTSELQSQSNLVCRLLLEKKNRQQQSVYTIACSACRTEESVECRPPD